MSDGSTQDARFPAGLATDTVPVDGRDLADLLAATLRTARATPRTDAAPGDWSGLLARDESVVIAAGVASRRASTAFVGDDVSGPDRVGGLAAWLSDWIAALDGIDDQPGTGLATRIERAVGARLDGDWRHWTDGSPEESRSRLARLLGAIGTAQDLAAARLADSLASGVHEPAAGLLVVLAQVYQTVQEHLNGFQARHLDFYFNDVLKLRPQPAQPDAVHLLFARDPAFAGDAMVAAGTAFAAGKDAAGAAIVFEATETLVVTDARVVALKTLRFDRDPLIVPENILGMTTAATVAEFGPVIAAEPAAAGAAIFGGDVPGCIGAASRARVGLAVAAPILWLAEGDRTIDVRIAFDCVRLAIDDAIDPVGVRKLLAAAFARWLFADDVTADEVAAIRSLVAPDVATMVTAGAPRDPAAQLLMAFLDSQNDATRDIVCEALLPGLFVAEVSTATGWATLPDPAYLPGRGLGLRLAVPAKLPPIVACSAVHGPEWSRDAPTLRLTLDRRSRLFGLSLFDGARLRSIRLDVAVADFRGLRLYNQFGQLDAGKPFKPFGPLPDAASYLVIGADETARKALTAFELTLDWSGLPADFATYYAGYGKVCTDHFAADDFRAAPAVLRDGRWVPQPRSLPLFHSVDGVLAVRQSIALDPRPLAASWRIGEPVPFDQATRNGFVRLGLVAGPAVFGHAAYPLALSDAVRHKDWRPAALPLPPYTPQLARIALRYTAMATIAVGSAGPHEAILQIRPFGVRTVQPSGDARRPTVLPAVDGDGQLLIGLAGSALAGELTLFFELRSDSARGGIIAGATLQWSWLADDAWVSLAPSRVLADTTHGFLRSGIVRLDLPAGPARGNTILPADLFWLRVASDAPSDAFAGLAAVHAQALLASRRAGADPAVPLPPNAITTASAVLPGIVAVVQPEAGFGLRRAETPRRQRIRMTERLRHKGRASTAWDYERLVLEAFPEVYKAKCLANTRLDRPFVEVPGAVLVVVVPAAPAAMRTLPGFRTRPLRLPADDLDRIERFVSSVASPLAAVRVVNAAYDFVEVRCRVELAPAARPGSVFARIKAAITDYLSPWTPGGLPPTFDWTLQVADIVACVRAVDPAIVAVTGVSLIRTWEEDAGRFRLDDTARATGDGMIRRSRPWSLVLPVPDHIIAAAEPGEMGGPEVTGMAQDGIACDDGDPAGLRIDETFIIGSDA